MKILFLANHLEVGGITSYLLSLAQELVKRGHAVYIASSPGGVSHDFIKAGVVLLPVPMRTKQALSPKVSISFLKLRPQIKTLGIDIVHSNSRTTQVVGFLLWRFCGCAHVSTCHGFFRAGVLRRHFPFWGTMVVAVSEQVREHLRKDFKLLPERIAVIANGIDVDYFSHAPEISREEHKRKIGLESGPVIAIIARLSDVKGHYYLLSAMPQVLESEPSAQLLIVGEGKMYPELLEQAVKLGILRNVRFLPTIADTRGILGMTDIFVMPSLQEGLGLSVMEAMASGVAVVGSDVGGLKSLIHNGVTGLAVRPADVSGLAQAIITLLKNDEMRRTLGQAGRAFMKESFSCQRMAQATEEVYKRCLLRKG